MKLDSYIEELVKKERDCRGLLPSDYWTLIAHPWFEDIAFKKAVEYGVDCFQRLGPKAFVVNTSAVYYRWKQLTQVQHNGLSHPSVLNALQDSFGFSIIFHIILGTEVIFTGTVTDPYQDDEFLISEIWEGNAYPDWVASVALRQSYSMYVKTLKGEDH